MTNHFIWNKGHNLPLAKSWDSLKKSVNPKIFWFNKIPPHGKTQRSRWLPWDSWCDLKKLGQKWQGTGDQLVEIQEVRPRCQRRKEDWLLLVALLGPRNEFFLRCKIKVKFVEWGTRWTVIAFFVAELCRVRIFARVFGWFWQGSAPTTSQKLKPQSKVLILSWKQPVTRIGIWFVCCLLASFEESADGRSRVEDSVQMTGEHDLQ